MPGVAMPKLATVAKAAGSILVAGALWLNAGASVAQDPVRVPASAPGLPELTATMTAFMQHGYEQAKNDPAIQALTTAQIAAIGACLGAVAADLPEHTRRNLASLPDDFGQALTVIDIQVVVGGGAAAGDRAFACYKDNGL